jgi:hypothetical protein
LNNIAQRSPAAGILSVCPFSAAPSSADVVNLTGIGTWTTDPNAPNPGGLAAGGKFVVMFTIALTGHYPSRS